MSAQRNRSWLRHLLIAACLAMLFLDGSSYAAAADAPREPGANSGNSEIKVDGLTRKQALDQLFAGLGIEIVWLNRAVADELVSGNFRGTLPEVARELLAQTNFVAAVARVENELRITRLVIVGRASGQSSPGLPALETALRRPKEASGPSQPASPSKHPVRVATTSLAPQFGTVAARSNQPIPTPRKAAGPLPVPTPIQARASLTPSPRTGALPSVAPVPGASEPTLTGPQPTPAAN